MNKKITSVRVECNLCGSTRFDVFYKEKVANNLVSYLLCRNCGLRFVSAHPGLDLNLDEIYAKEYGSNEVGKRLLEVDYYSDLHAAKEIFKKQLDVISKYAKKGSILDVGCGTGWFLKRAQEIGWETQGVDVSKLFVDYCRDKLGLRVVHGTLEDAHFSKESFNVVKLRHVLEHVDNPTSFLEEVKRIMKKDGLLLIETPNCEALRFEILSACGKILRKDFCRYNLYYPIHIYGFSPVTIEKLLRKMSFSVIAINTVDTWDKVWCAFEPEFYSRSRIYKNKLHKAYSISRILMAYLEYLFVKIMVFFERVCARRALVIALAQKI